MPSTLNKTLRQLRSTRDLRAEILSAAADIASGEATSAVVTVEEPVISAETVQTEWDRAIQAIALRIGKRMQLKLEPRHSSRRGKKVRAFGPRATPLLLDRPNYRYEVLRLLIGASLENEGPQPVSALMEKLGASVTPVREALLALQRAGVAHLWPREGADVDVRRITADLLGKVRAAPQTLRFRFERGTQIKPPAHLVKRATQLVGARGPDRWKHLALSGVPVAMADDPALDLMGTPRLDLVAQVGRDTKVFDGETLRLLDDGLEPEPNLTAPAPVVVTVVRAYAAFTRDAGLPSHPRCAHSMDVFLSLLDAGLHEQAMQYAMSIFGNS